MKPLLQHLARIRYRILAVNLLVLLVPVVGLEFARIYERQLLTSLERNMRDQAILTRRHLEADADWRSGRGRAHHAGVLTTAARDTRTRIRILDAAGAELIDSHEDGPPEGPEPRVPSLVRGGLDHRARSDAFWQAERKRLPLEKRPEVLAALSGTPGAHTRVGPEAVYLFVSEPVLRGGAVEGAVYVIRSTRPVLLGLYRIRNGLIRVLAGAAGLSVLLTLLLSWTISRPLGQLSRAATRIAAGERDVSIPTTARGGEIGELSESLHVMTERLDARMRAMAEFAADVAHEFKSPLTSIRGAAELLSQGALDDPTARERFLRNIELDTERLDQLVSALLELGRVDAAEGVKETFDLESSLSAAAQRAGTPEVDVVLQYGAPGRMVHARRRDLEAAVANLLDNAVRHAPAGSSVGLTVSAGADGALELTVRDRGPGVPAALQERIFKRFFTTDEDRGTGLGLSIAATVARGHGGTLELRSIDGPGACFALRLPIAA